MVVVGIYEITIPYAWPYTNQIALNWLVVILQNRQKWNPMYHGIWFSASPKFQACQVVWKNQGRYW